MKKFYRFSFFLFMLCALVFNTKLLAQVALNFNGVNNVVTSNGAPVLGNQARTVDAWIKTTSTISTQMVICDWGAMTPNASRFTLNMIASKPRIEIGGVGMTGTTVINTGAWFHITAVYESSITSGSNVFLFVNGLPEASGTFTGYPVLSTTNTVGFRIGARADGINLFNGNIDEVKVYNYARTQAQVAADTLEYCGTIPGLVAYYKLNEGVPNATNTTFTTALDYSGFNNHGTLNSFTLSGTASNWVPGRVSRGAATISVSPGANICNSNSISLSTNATANFTWSTGNSSSTVLVLSPSVSTVYSITAINSIGCSNTTTLAINVNSTVPSVTTSVSQNPICFGASAALSASGAATYSWSNGVSNGQLFTPSTTATYTLIAGNGCGTVSAVQTISVTPLQITLSVSSPSVCEGSTCALSAGSSVNGYTWMPGSQTGSTIVVGPLNNPIYTVSASNGTCVGSGTILVNTVASPTIVTSNTLLTLCSGLSGSVSVSGAGTNGTYTWMPGNLSGTAVVLSPSITTGYTVSGTNGAGCSASILLPVVVYPSPTIAIAASKTIACIGESVTLLGSGAATYTWNTGANTGSLVVTSNTANNTYTLSGTAGNTTCTSTQSIALAVVNPSVNYSATQAICNGQSATLTASGATTYTWNGIPTGSTGITVVYPVNTSTYALVANTQSGSANCFNFYTATVQVNALPNLLVAMSKTTNICKGESNTLTVSGAANYTWMPGNTVGSVAIVSPTANTTYTVTGTNSLSCSASSLALVKVDPCTDISSMFVESQWQVYPNPFNDILNIETSIACDVYLYDMGGRLVDHYALKPGINQIPTHDLTSGVYSLKAFGEGGVWVSKVVK